MPSTQFLLNPGNVPHLPQSKMSQKYLLDYNSAKNALKFDYNALRIIEFLFGL